MSTVEWSGAENLREFLVPIGDLRPFPGNARRGDVEKIAESLRRFGQVRAVLVTPDNTIVAGHHVTKAAQALGWTHVAAIEADFTTRDEALAYLVADNQLSSLGHIETVEQMTLLEEIEQSGAWEGTGFTETDLADMRTLALHKTEMVSAGELKRHEQNYRQHPADQVLEITKSLLQHGFYRNVVCAKDGTILAGHAVVEAAMYAGVKKIPVTRLDIEPGSPEALKILAGDNELLNRGEINDRVLTDLLNHVSEADAQGLTGTGHDLSTLASLLMVTRPSTEIKDIDHAMHWVGMPEFDANPGLRLTVHFETEENRAKFMELIGHQGLSARSHGDEKRVASIWWPDRPRTDWHSLRFDDLDDLDENINSNTVDVFEDEDDEEFPF